MRRAAAVFFASLAGFAAGAAAREYSAESIEAMVIDAATRQPVGNALVIARWIAKGDGGLHAPHDVGSVQVLETVTGENGRFAFPAWGPASYAGAGVLLDDDPLILVYKNGYHVARLGNSQYRVPPSKDFRDRKTGAVRASLWNGETVELKPFGAEGIARIDAYNRFVASDLWPMFAETTPCDWQRMPRTIAYLDAAKKALAAQGIGIDRIASLRDRLVMNETFFAGKRCGSPRAELKEAP
jgi:hypothetical protein